MIRLDVAGISGNFRSGGSQFGVKRNRVFQSGKTQLSLIALWEEN
jgi:hypothetical protein